MTPAQLAAVLAAGAGWALAGLAWTVRLVVYPAFSRVGVDSWSAYHSAHLRGMTLAVGPPWAAQGLAVLGLLLADPGPLTWLHAGLAAVPVGLTVAAAVPLHRRLQRGPDPALLDRLIRVHSLRTAAWTAAAALATVLLLRSV